MPAPTPNEDGRLSIQACAMRICRLNADGSPIYSSATAAWADKAFAKLDITAVIEAGDQFTTKNAGGGITVNYRDCDTIRWADLSLEVLRPDPEFMELTINGSLYTLSGNTIGFQFPQLAGGSDSYTPCLDCPNPVSIEVWSKAVLGNVQATTDPFIRWLLPLAFLHEGNQAFANSPQSFMFAGWAGENPNYGDGPFSDWTDDQTTTGNPLDSTRYLQYVNTPALPPYLQQGYQPTPADV